MSDNENIYSAPEASLDTLTDKTSLEHFNRFSAWGVFGLSVLTLGLYAVFWLYNRAQRINTCHADKVPSWPLKIFVGMYIINTVASIANSISPENMTILSIYLLSTLLYFILYIMVVFGIRKRLVVITGAPMNGILAFFFNAIYFQYKINQAKDAQ